eukprot:gene56102-74905_t
MATTTIPLTTPGTGGRRASVERATKETRIAAAINLDGTGVYDIKTGIGFLDHMLEQLSRHSLIDITLRAEGEWPVQYARAVGIKPDFPREWRRHAALAASFSNVNRRYTRVAQCTKAEVLGLQPQNDYAGVALLWMESLEVALEVNNDPQIIERLRPDEVRVFGSEVTHCAMFTEETVLLDGPAASFVVIEFLKRFPN